MAPLTKTRIESRDCIRVGAHFIQCRLVLLSCIVAVVFGQESASDLIPAEFRWAQRKDRILLTIELQVPSSFRKGVAVILISWTDAYDYISRGLATILLFSVV